LKVSTVANPSVASASEYLYLPFGIWNPCKRSSQRLGKNLFLNISFLQGVENLIPRHFPINSRLNQTIIEIKGKAKNIFTSQRNLLLQGSNGHTQNTKDQNQYQDPQQVITTIKFLYLDHEESNEIKYLIFVRIRMLGFQRKTLNLRQGVRDRPNNNVQTKVPPFFFFVLSH